MEPLAHYPVLLDEAVLALNLRGDGIYVDATFGRGGHSAAILKALGPDGRLLAFDRDPQAVEVARERFGADARFTMIKGPFSMLAQAIDDRGLRGRIDGILLDLGVSSPQLDDPARGFSFRHTGPLDMRMDPGSGMSASAWLMSADEKDIARVIRDYGEERYARRIAGAICRERERAPIVTTADLARIVAAAVPTRERNKDPATRTFQAVRMQVNRELEEIEAVLPQALSVLAVGGRLVVISFHSLEDRIVKQFMRRESSGDELPPDLPVRHVDISPRLRLLGKRRAGPEETARNPRSRSAVLRIAEVLRD